MVAFEICIDSVISAQNALAAGCERVELCASLVEGGITASAGMIAAVRACVPHNKMQVIVLIRPRGGDFCYSKAEQDIMLYDIQLCKTLGVDGVAIGALCADGTVDIELTQRLVQAASPMLVTFHRAFDMTRNAMEAMEAIINITGITRILTSGHDKTALDGLDEIVQLHAQARGRIIIIAAGGITQRNVARIVKESNVQEVHMSGRSKTDSIMTFRNGNVTMGATFGPSEFANSIADVNILSSCRSLFNATS